MPDYSDRYNTPLSPDQEIEFYRWMAELTNRRGGRDAMRDLYDYDMRGAFASGLPTQGGHYPDTYKKPNHPTFSDQSQYNRPPYMVGGQWGQLAIPGPVRVDTFTPSRYGRTMWDENAMRDYFKFAEPNAVLDYWGRR